MGEADPHPLGVLLAVSTLRLKESGGPQPPPAEARNFPLRSPQAAVHEKTVRSVARGNFISLCSRKVERNSSLCGRATVPLGTRNRQPLPYQRKPPSGRAGPACPRRARGSLYPNKYDRTSKKRGILSKIPRFYIQLLLSNPRQTLISTSTPLGSSSFIKASIVLEVEL